MIKIRFTRIGRKHDPHFRVVAVDSRKSAKSGVYLESLGFYNPATKQFDVKADRVKYWISQGAQVSDTVHNLLIKAKVIEGKKIDVSSKKKKGDEDAQKAEQSEQVVTEKKPTEVVEVVAPVE